MTTVTERAVPTRRISFEESLQSLPKHFAADGDLVMSHIVAMLSSVFPDGEDFFVRSVRAHRDQVEDPELKRQVAGFIGQEAIHGREHRQFNARLAELGYPTRQVERFTEKALKFRERIAPPRANLAATAALEHYTATLAELLLEDPAARATIEHDEVRNLFLWHALEESEHKAVAFDVYRISGGSERLRTITMDLITVGFLFGMAMFTLYSLAHDRSARNPVRLAKSLWNLRRSPFLKKSVWRRLRDYNRRDFHPDDHDTEAFVAHWREELFGESGTLNDRLVGRAA